MKIKISIAFIAIILVVHFTLLVPIKKTAVSARLALRSAKEVYGLVKNQDIVNASEKLKETRAQLEATQKNLDALTWTKTIPFWGHYYADADHLVKAGLHGLDTGIIITESLRPHADLLGLKGEGSFVLGSAEVRIEKAVQTMDKIIPIIDEVENKLLLIKKEVDPINPNRYPAAVFGKKVHSQIILAKQLVDQGCFILSNAKPLIENLPRLLGEPVRTRYLALFQNNKRLDSADKQTIIYAPFRVEHGKISLEGSDYIFQTDELETKDLATTENLKKLYDDAKKRKAPDGIIVVDTHALAKIMELMKPINPGSIQFTNRNDPRCNCPDFIYELEDYISRPKVYAREKQNNLFGNFTNVIIQKALGSSPRLYWGKLSKIIIEEFKQKHILIYFPEEKLQKGIEALMSADT